MTFALRFLAGLIAVGAVLATPYLAQSYPTGAPSGSAGNFGFTCASSGCHDSFELNSGTGSVVIDAPQAVAPGETVTITVTVDNTTAPAPGSERVQGFEATVRDLSGGQNGGVFTGAFTLTDPDRTRYPIGNDTEYVTHTLLGQEVTSWSFDWTAPAEVGPATIFAAGNAANGNSGGGGSGGASGDYVYTTTREIAVTTAGEAGPDLAGLELAAVRPNPVRDRASTVLTLPAAATVTARLVDGRGRTVRALAQGERRAGDGAIALDVRGLAPGTYFLVVEADGARRTQPVVVAR